MAKVAKTHPGGDVRLYDSPRERVSRGVSHVLTYPGVSVFAFQVSCSSVFLFLYAFKFRGEEHEIGHSVKHDGAA